MKLKKVFSILLVLAMIAGMAPQVPIHIHAASVKYSGTCGKNVTWVIDNNWTLTISGTGDMDNYSQTSAPWYSQRLNIKKVVIEDGVTSIGNWSLYGFNYATSIEMADSVTRIGVGAMRTWFQLTNLVIGNGVTSIGAEAFYYCNNLTEVTIGRSLNYIGQDAFYDCKKLSIVRILDLAAWCGLQYGNYASRPQYYASHFYVNGSYASEVVIPEGVTAIGDFAFYKWSCLTAVSIPSTVTSIGNAAFGGNKELARVEISEGVTSIGESAFESCSSLTTLKVPDSVTSIGAYAFGACTNLTTLHIGAGVMEIGMSAFDGCGNLRYNSYDNAKYLGNAENPYVVLVKATAESITSCQIHPDTKLINGSAFTWCRDLTEISIPDGVRSIGDFAFELCSSLTSIKIPDTVTRMNQSAFYQCTALAEVTLGKGLTTIPPSAFAGCSSLQNIVIPANITCIEGGAFYEAGLTNLTVPGTVKTIGNSAFAFNKSLTSVKLEEGVNHVKREAFWACSNLRDLSIPNSIISFDDAISSCTSLQYTAYDNAKYLGNQENPYLVLVSAKNTSITSCNIHPDTRLIYYYSFANCTNLTNIVIPDQVIGIGRVAFSSAGLKSITISASLSRVEEDAFKNCEQVTSIYITDLKAWCGIEFGGGECNPIAWNTTLYLNSTPVTELAGLEGITAIGDFAFDDYRQFSSIILPDSLVSVGKYAFSSCANATYVVIGKNLTDIGERAFSYCGNLWHILYKGTEEEWELLTDKVGLASITVHCNSMGDEVMDAENRLCALCCEHDLIDGVVVSPTCTSEGYTIYQCSRCGYGVKTDITSATPHIGQWDVIKEATCTDMGLMGRTCIECGKYEEQALSLKEHGYGDWIVDIAPTCTQYGTAYRVCADCGWTTSEAVSPTGHNYGPWVTDREPDCENTGSKYRICSNCGDENRETISADGHDYVTTVVPPTCTEQGYTTHACPCGHSYTDAYVAETGHNYVDDVCTNCGEIQRVVTEFGFCGDDLTWELDNRGVLIIAGTGDMWDWSTGNAPWYESRKSITAVVIESGATSIGYCAFEECTNLTSVTIPMGVTSIGSRAFYYCNDLKEIIIPNTVTSIGNNAFYYCIGLTEITIPGSVTSIGFYAFKHCSGLTSLTLQHGLVSIGQDAFSECRELTDVVIPDSVTTMGSGVFSRCFKLSSVKLSAGMSSIPSSTFRECTSLTSVVIPDNITTISTSVFSKCTGLISVTLPSSITEIGMLAFDGCTGLWHVLYAGTEEQWAAVKKDSRENPLLTATIHFNCDGDEILDLENKLCILCCEHSVSHWENIQEVTCTQPGIDAGVCDICGTVVTEETIAPGHKGQWVTEKEPTCTELGGKKYICTVCGHTETLEIPMVDHISQWVTDQEPTCTEPGSKRYACTVCGYGETYEIPVVDHIGQWVTDQEPSCTEKGRQSRICTVCGQTQTQELPMVDHQYLGGICDLCGDVIWPLSGKCGDNLTWTLVQTGNLTISGTGAMYNYTAENPAPWHRVAHLIKRITVSSGATSVGDNAFCDCVSVTSISLPKTITSIGHLAFSGCAKLNSAPIPEGITEIRDGAFSGCALITSASIPNSVTKIGNEAFKGCEKLIFVTFPEGLTHIGDYAFYGCTELTRVTIVPSIVSIGKYAFAGCTGLTSITFEGEVPSFGENAFGGVVAYAMYSECNNTWNQDACQNYGGTLTWSVSSANHDWGDWVITEEPTCNKKGWQQRACQYCGKTQSSSASRLTHSFTNYVSDGNATTEADGTKTAYCDHGCGAYDTVIDTGSKIPVKITSEVYTVADGWVSNVSAGTTVAAFLNGIDGNDIRITQDGQAVAGTDKMATGMMVELMSGGVAVDVVIVIIIGDVNGDGNISVTDMLAVKAHLLDKEKLDGAYAKAADIAEDNNISITDFIQIKAYLLGLS